MKGITNGERILNNLFHTFSYPYEILVNTNMTILPFFSDIRTMNYLQLSVIQQLSFYGKENVLPKIMPHCQLLISIPDSF